MWFFQDTCRMLYVNWQTINTSLAGVQWNSALAWHPPKNKAVLVDNWIPLDTYKEPLTAALEILYFSVITADPMIPVDQWGFVGRADAFWRCGRWLRRDLAHSENVTSFCRLMAGWSHSNFPNSLVMSKATLICCIRLIFNFGFPGLAF